jgi:hypothetical protein
MGAKEPCPEGLVRDLESKQCRERKKPGRKPSRPPCLDNQTRDAITKECREKKKPGRKSAEPITKPISEVLIVSQKRPKSTPCKRVMTLTQKGATCWFNSLMMGIFFSQGMRGVLMKAMKNWIAAPEQPQLKSVYETLKDIILQKFLHKDGKWAEKPFDKLGRNAIAFALITPEHILTMLNMVNPHVFFNRGIAQEQDGGHGHAYILALLHLLHVNNYALIDERTTRNVIEYNMSRMYGLSYQQIGDKLFSFYDPDLYSMTTLASNPDILVIKRDEVDKWANNPTIKLKKNQLVKHDNTTYVFNKKQYIVDSLYLTNFNVDSCNSYHAIAGVTCSNKRFMYNGWARDTVDSAIKQQQKGVIACPLMELDWAEDLDFCIDMSNCSMRNLKIQNVKNVLCFNSAKGNRFIIAVRKDIYEAGFDYNRSLSAPAAALKNVCPGKKVAYNPASQTCEDISTSKYPH